MKAVAEIAFREVYCCRVGSGEDDYAAARAVRVAVVEINGQRRKAKLARQHLEIDGRKNAAGRRTVRSIVRRTLSRRRLLRLRVRCSHLGR